MTAKTSKLFQYFCKISNVFKVNPFVPEIFVWNFDSVIFKLILLIDGWGIFREIALRRMPLDLTDDKSTSVRAMVWCYYLS